MNTSLLMFLLLVGITLLIAAWAARRVGGLQRLLRRRTPDQRLAERNCRGRRLYERRVLPWYCWPDCLQWL
jgi:hypothetical protein